MYGYKKFDVFYPTGEMHINNVLETLDKHKVKNLKKARWNGNDSPSVD